MWKYVRIKIRHIFVMVLLVWGLKYSLLPSEFLTFEKKNQTVCVCLCSLLLELRESVRERVGTRVKKPLIGSGQINRRLLELSPVTGIDFSLWGAESSLRFSPAWAAHQSYSTHTIFLVQASCDYCELQPNRKTSAEQHREGETRYNKDSAGRTEACSTFTVLVQVWQQQ